MDIESLYFILLSEIGIYVKPIFALLRSNIFSNLFSLLIVDMSELKLNVLLNIKKASVLSEQ